MQRQYIAAAFAAGLVFSTTAALAADTGDAEIGRQLFRVCATCHSLEPGRHMTGPSLASIWGRKAGSVADFRRYSGALKDADVLWDEPSLDAWLADPQAFIANNRMSFPGLPDGAKRRDLIAFLRSASQEAGMPSGQQADGMSEGMMGQRQPLDLKQLDANNRISVISHCGDTYTVTAETGEAYQFWEFNLRFKTDSSDLGPPPGHPVIIPASMQGDRAFVVFASPVEISPFIANGC